VSYVSNGRYRALAAANAGAPTGAVDYALVYVAQKNYAWKRWGALMPGSPYPRTPRTYSQEIFRWWQAEANRVLAWKQTCPSTLGFSNSCVAAPGGGVFDLSNAKGNSNQIDALVKEWQRYYPRVPDLAVILTTGFGSQAKAFHPEQTSLNIADTQTFWDQTARVGIGFNSVSVIPSWQGQVWSAVVESAKELPGHLVNAGKEIAGFAGRAAFGVIWNVLKPLLPVVALGFGGVFLYQHLRKGS
jgi:hypothetical protein